MPRNQTPNDTAAYRPMSPQSVRRLSSDLLRRLPETRSPNGVSRILRQVPLDDAAAVLAYTIWTLNGELLITSAGKSRYGKPSDIRQWLASLKNADEAIQKSLRERRDHQLALADRPRTPGHRLPETIKRHLRTPSFRAALREVVEADGLQLSSLVSPDGRLLTWAAEHRMRPSEKSRQSITGLLQADDGSVVSQFIENARWLRDVPLDPRIAARFIALWPRVERRFQHILEETERLVLSDPLTSDHLKQIRNTYRSRAFLGFQHRRSEGLTAEQTAQARKFSHGPDFTTAKTRWLQEAVALTARHEPELRAALLKAEGHESGPCADCADEALEVIAPHVAPPPAAGEDRSAEFPSQAVTVIANACSHPDSTLTGLAWVSTRGDIGTSCRHSSSPVEARLLAICQAVHALGPRSSITILCSHLPTVRQADQLLSRRPEDTASSPFMAGNASFLPVLVGQSDRIRVQLVEEQTLQILDKAAGELASLALRAEKNRGLRSVLKKKIAQVREQLTVPSPVLSGASGAKTAPSKVFTLPDGTLQWVQTLTESDWAEWTFSLPPGFPELSGGHVLKGGEIAFTVAHRSQDIPKAEFTFHGRLLEDGSRIELEHHTWFQKLFPGLRLTCQWDPVQRSLKVSSKPLNTPVRFAGQKLAHDYDPAVLVRRTAPGGPGRRPDRALSVPHWVLRTLQVLGHLTDDGHVVLAESSLQRNMLEIGFPPDLLPKVPDAVAALIHEGRVRQVAGSLGSAGRPIPSARSSLSSVGLLSYRPEVVALPSGEPSRPTHRTGAKNAHVVSGFVRRLPYGQSPSDEAIQAHEEAVRRAELANGGPLPPGYTFVQKHERGTSRRRRKR